jgi:hypothetical protein
MMKDIDIAVDNGDADRKTVREEFLRETCSVFEFADFEEGDRVLQLLEKAILGISEAEIDEPLEHMKKLVDLFKDYKFESELRYRAKIYSWCRIEGCMLSIVHLVPGRGVGTTFRCGKLPAEAFRTEDIPRILADEVARITGIRVAPDEARITWNICDDKKWDDYTNPRDYFLDGKCLGWKYKPKTRIPGERWRIHISQTSHEISAACQRMQLFEEGYITVEERLVRWGLALYIAEKIEKFRREYRGRPREWNRILKILDVCEADMQNMTEFVDRMPSLNPISDPIPIRVCEVLTVFRVLFRLSLKLFELAYNAST